MARWRRGADVNREKLEILHKFEGRSVILGIGVRAIVDQAGTLELESEGSVILNNPKTGVRTVRLSDIRWVVDPDTRARVGGPW